MERFDPLSAYLREVQRHRLLSPEETQALSEKFVTTQDSAAAARLVTSNLRLVVKIAYEYRRAYKNIMDLIQEGNIGLMQAVKRYDPYRGVKLSSYAAWWIRAYILRFILNNWRLVKLRGRARRSGSCSSICERSAPSWWLSASTRRTPRSRSSSTCPRAKSPRWRCASSRARSRSTPRWATARVAPRRRSTRCRASSRGPSRSWPDSELQGLLKEKARKLPRDASSASDKDLASLDERLRGRRAASRCRSLETASDLRERERQGSSSG